MNWQIKAIIIIILFWSCENPKNKAEGNSQTEYLIEATDLQKIAKNANIKILDFRARNEYEQSHIVNAINITRADIENPLYPYSGVMPEKSQIEDLFGKLGINSGDTLVLYDDNGLCEATRLWWILQNFDYMNVKLLNGGFTSWTQLNGEVTSIKPELKSSSFKLPDNPSMRYFISREELTSIINENVVIIDARTLDEYYGRHLKNGALKAGRIPNSNHMDWAQNINFAHDKKLKSKEEIKKNYAFLNLSKSDLIVLYCHSGVRSAHSTFVLSQILGFENVKNYDGSWVEWTYFDDSPIELEMF